MSDLAIIAASANSALRDIAKTARGLGTGLQNAAPGTTTTPNYSIEYLLKISDTLDQLAGECEKLVAVAQNIQNRP